MRSTKTIAPGMSQGLLFRLLLLMVFAGWATVEAGRHGATSEEEAAIRELTEQLWASLGEHDLEAFQAICSEDWNLYTAQGARFTAERLFEVHEANIRNFELEAEEFEVRIHGDLAWATYLATMKGERQGEPWGGEFLMTHIYERRGDGWISSHTHESRKPD